MQTLLRRGSNRQISRILQHETPDPIHFRAPRSHHSEPNFPQVLPLLTRVLLLRPPHLLDLPLQHLLRHLPLRRVHIHAPRMNR